MQDVPDPGVPETPGAPESPTPTVPPPEAPTPGGDVDIPSPQTQG